MLGDHCRTFWKFTKIDSDAKNKVSSEILAPDSGPEWYAKCLQVYEPSFTPASLSNFKGNFLLEV